MADLSSGSSISNFDVALITATAAWNNMPAALTEIFGATAQRVKIDLTHYKKFRLVTNQAVAGVLGALLRVEYSIAEVTWINLEDTTLVGDLSISSTGTQIGGIANIISGARNDVFIRIVGVGGDGAADPSWREIHIQFFN